MSLLATTFRSIAIQVPSKIKIYTYSMASATGKHVSQTGFSINAIALPRPYEIGDNVIPFDMTNNDFINWQIQTYAIPASQNGYDAIAADNLNLDNQGGACGSYHNGKWVQRYSGQDNDPQWEKDVLYWVTQMQAKLHALPHPL